MRSYFFLLILVTAPVFTFSTERKHSYAKAIKKIMGRTWWQYKVCENDTCSIPEDSLFFDGSFDDFETYYKDHSGQCLRCISPIAFALDKNSIGTSRYLRCFDCIPLICFMDTTIDENRYPIYTIGMSGKKQGLISFISDSEFVMSRQSIVRTDSLLTGKRVYSIYYKLAHLSK